MFIRRDLDVVIPLAILASIRHLKWCIRNFRKLIQLALDHVDVIPHLAYGPQSSCLEELPIHQHPGQEILYILVRTAASP